MVGVPRFPRVLFSLVSLMALAPACGTSEADYLKLAEEALANQGYSSVKLTSRGEGRFSFEGTSDEGQSCSGELTVNTGRSFVSSQCSGSGTAAKAAPEDLRLACDRGDGEACADEGDRLVRGEGGAPDLAAALALFQKGCDKGHARSCYLGAKTILMKGPVAEYTPARGIAFAERACEGDSGPGCAVLGTVLLEGKQVAKDEARAAKALEKACTLDEALGCANLGIVYAKGLGVEADVAVARRYLQKACELKLDMACQALEKLASTEQPTCTNPIDIEPKPPHRRVTVAELMEQDKRRYQLTRLMGFETVVKKDGREEHMLVEVPGIDAASDAPPFGATPAFRCYDQAIKWTEVQQRDKDGKVVTTREKSEKNEQKLALNAVTWIDLQDGSSGPRIHYDFAIDNREESISARKDSEPSGFDVREIDKVQPSEAMKVALVRTAPDALELRLYMQQGTLSAWIVADFRAR